MGFIKHDKLVYLSGGMSGLPNHNYEAFFEAEKHLRAAGYDVANPARMNEIGVPWHVCLRNDISCIAQYCEGIALLPGWQNSAGATFELAAALKLKMYVIDAITMKPLDIQVSFEFTGADVPVKTYTF